LSWKKHAWFFPWVFIKHAPLSSCLFEKHAPLSSCLFGKHAPLSSCLFIKSARLSTSAHCGAPPLSFAEKRALGSNTEKTRVVLSLVVCQTRSAYQTPEVGKGRGRRSLRSLCRLRRPATRRPLLVFLLGKNARGWRGFAARSLRSLASSLSRFPVKFPVCL